MSDQENKINDLLKRQQDLLDAETVEFLSQTERFSPAQFHSVTAGQDHWQPHEEKQIRSDPILQGYAAMWQEAAGAVNPKGDGGVDLENDDDAKNYILRFEPSAAPLFDLDGLRLLPEAAGDGDLPEDLAAVEDIYCARLGPTGTFRFGFGCLGDDEGDLCILDLSSGEDSVAAGMVIFDSTTDRVVVDAARFPVNEWRFYYVGPVNVYGSRTGRRAVFALVKGQQQEIESSSACQLILQGRLMDALVATAEEKPDRQRLICRRWVLVARMELMLKREALPAMENRLRNPSYEFLLSELREIADRKLDLVKQSLTEMLPR